MLRISHTRPGLSLMEALVSLFIMAIGLLSLLTLFPLGALQMGQALKDDRCAQCAWQADGIVRSFWQTGVIEVSPGNEETFWKGMDTPGGNLPPLGTTDRVPSYVVGLDPIGYQARGGTTSASVQWYSNDTAGIRRYSSKLITDLQGASAALQYPVAVRACTMSDDIFFNANGLPDTVSGTPGRVVRQGRYNWMAFIQRPNNADRYVANLKIAVFDGRPPGSAPANSEITFATNIAAGSSQVTLPISRNDTVTWTNANPFPLRNKSSWILDNSGGSRMDFYRVMSMTDSGGNTILELDTPLKQTMTKVTILRGLAEVFERPVLAPTSYQPPTP